MTRLSATNQAEVEKATLSETLMVKLEFSTPVYVHSGTGVITYDSNDYLGIGHYGEISNVTETEALRPSSLRLQLTGVESSLLSEALDSGNFGDPVTIFCGYRTDDGALIDTPWIEWKGFFEYASISEGKENVISVVVQHDLGVLPEKNGARFSDEDQQVRFPGDLGFQFVADMANVKLNWGGRVIGGNGRVGDPRAGGWTQRLSDYWGNYYDDGYWDGQ